MRHAGLALAILLACGGTDDRPAADTAATAASLPPAAASAAATATRGESGTSACPATGLWSQCAVVNRLDRAGLAPRVDSVSATEPPLAPRGTLVRIGRSELELYVYADPAARERDQRKLDRQKYIAGDAPIGMEAQPTLIHSVNLIAILHSRNDHQRERVFDAITAGPPQPSPQ